MYFDSKDDSDEELKYLSGFGTIHSSESPDYPGAIPQNQLNPQKCPYGLYNEVISGTSFTTPRTLNQKCTMYRIRPSVVHRPFDEAPDEAPCFTDDWKNRRANPNQTSWLPFDFPKDGKHVDFLQGIKTLCGSGNPETRHGLAIHIYACNASMTDKCFYNSDGDLLIVPQLGTLYVTTEMGRIIVNPTEFLVLQQGIKFAISIRGPSRGYILEVFDGHFELPELGPIGTVGLADQRHFLSPTAWFEDRDVPNFKVFNKYQGALFVATQDHSPFDVIAWHGSYVPYKYDLTKFLPINSVSYDHLDPSIFTVITCPSRKPGVAIADFVIFPPRWIVQEHTLRPPYYHRNCMAEFMGLIFGDVAGEHGLRPGGASLHGTMTPHGPDDKEFENGLKGSQKPIHVSHYLSFMFETCLGLSVTNWGQNVCGKVDPDYYKIWQGLEKRLEQHL